MRTGTAEPDELLDLLTTDLKRGQPGAVREEAVFVHARAVSVVQRERLDARRLGKLAFQRVGDRDRKGADDMVCVTTAATVEVGGWRRAWSVWLRRWRPVRVPA